MGYSLFFILYFYYLLILIALYISYQKLFNKTSLLSAKQTSLTIKNKK
jgi:hypothetical protein